MRAGFFYGHGKLLLTGEYFVLEGAKALALPTRYGQSLSVRSEKSFNPLLTWKSIDESGKVWFEGEFELNDFSCKKSQSEFIAKDLQKILIQARKQNPHFLRESDKVEVESRLEFPINWGLGSSSTLIYNIAQWAYVAPFELLFNTLGGSGYDIACAQSASPIFFSREVGGPEWSQAPFDPSFKNNLYFVYLERKQSSKLSRELFAKRVNENKNDLIIKLSKITEEISQVTDLNDFEFLIEGHEKIISSSLDLPRAKDLYFQDFWGGIKSLGGWGGDFVLITSDRSKDLTQKYFFDKGFKTVIPYQQMILDVKNHVRH